MGLWEVLLKLFAWHEIKKKLCRLSWLKLGFDGVSCVSGEQQKMLKFKVWPKSQ